MMSTAAEGKEGKSNVMVSCKHLDGSFKEHNEKEGVRQADSAETLGVDLRTVKLGAKENNIRNTCDARFALAKRNRVIENS